MEVPRCAWCGISYYTVTLYEFMLNGEKVIACEECKDYQTSKCVTY